MAKTRNIRETATTSQALGPSESLEARIRVRAYEIYLDRGEQDGSELEDWLRAEREVLRAMFGADEESSRTIAAA
jgi:hypothetical protein